MSQTLVFTATIQLHGVNPYVLVSHEQAQALRPGWRKPMPVLVQVNDQPKQPWRINMMPVGDGSFYLYLHANVRMASNTKVGDVATIRVQFNDAYHPGPADPMPPQLAMALADNSKLRQNWDALPPSRQKEILRYLASLKSEEAVARNVAKVIAMVGGEAGRFMGRDWKDGV
ncbi:MAG TPA: YdeI/OmpD-associated family protein [Candidatus Saccharimonadales bacterium]|nr:YdeI/OmpD-associated family protein [Candidatus Saccharimonadales bacterium]